MGLTTTSFFGRMMQPEQDWLPLSIPQTYLMLASACSEDKRCVFIFSLLCLDDPIPGPRLPVLPSHRNQSARSPAHQGERDLILDRQSSPEDPSGETTGCCNKPYRPFLLWRAGSRLLKVVTVREQATGCDSGSYNSLGIALRGINLLEDILVEAAGEPMVWLVACSDT